MVADHVAPGWTAISEAFARFYGDQEPVHWGDALAPFAGPRRLDGISAYAAADHWHFVTLGISEIWTKRSNDADVSGLGFEFTMRVRRRRRPDPPAWVLKVLTRLAELSFEGSRFDVGHTLDPYGSITGGSSGRLQGMCFVEDPQLGAIWTPHGRVQFLQVVGITQSELRDLQVERTSTDRFAGPRGLYVTSP